MFGVRLATDLHRRPRTRLPRGWAIGALVVLGSLAAVPAAAQEGQACTWSLGTTGNYAFPARSFALLTPEGTWSVSPTLGTQCSPIHTAVWAPWAGVDFVPTLQHRYRRVAERGSVFMLARFGMDARVARSTRVGLHLTTNTTAWGSGLRVRYLPAPQSGFGIRGFDVRFDVMAGETPDLHAHVVVHLHNRWVGNRSEERHYEDATRWVQARSWHVGTGFELGTITALRVQLTPGVIGRTPEVGLRAGALTNLFADVAVQPIALAHVDFPLAAEADVQPQITGQLGVTRRDGRANPMLGASFELDPPSVPFQMHIGLLVAVDQGDVWQSLDAGFGSVW